MLARRAALVSCLWASLVLAGCADHRGSDIPPAPWAQLEMARGAGGQIVVWLDLSGSFEGHKGTTARTGQLSPEQLSAVRSLFRDERIAIYQSDALPADGSVDLTGTAERPIFRIVVRGESGQIQAGTEKLQAYFAERSQHAETEQMLSVVKSILERL